MDIIFFGTPLFASKILLHLIQKKCSIKAIVTQSDRDHYGRPQIPPVKQVALEYLPHVPIFQPLKASNEEFFAQLKQCAADFFVVVAYGQILKQSLLDLPKKVAVNIHASLLPKYRGAAPMQRCLMNGEKETGITLMKMAAQMDAGDILSVGKVAIKEGMIFSDLEEALCAKAQELLLPLLSNYDNVTPIPQDHSLATYAPKISPEECEIRWDREGSEQLHLIQGLSLTPGAFCWAWIGKEKKRLKILRAELLDLTGKPGEILAFQKDRFIIATAKGALRIYELQLEGKRKMSAEEFFCGHQGKFSLEIVS